MAEADVIVIGAGLAGLVATAELADAGRRVVVLDQEPESSLGGQASWSFGGLFLVGTPEQRRLGIRDQEDLALADWLASAELTDGPNDLWARRWAEAYVAESAGDLRHWLRTRGVKLFPAVQWPERGGYLADGPGSSVPRFHIVWGTGPALVAPFAERVRAAADDGLVDLRFRHRVGELLTEGGSVVGCAGTVLDPDLRARQGGNSDLRRRQGGGGDFEVRAPAVLVATGGIGGNHDLVRRFWPARYGAPPDDLLQGVPDHVDGSGLLAAQDAGGAVTNIERMWSYPEAIPHHTPVWSNHAVRILAGPSSLWLDARGRRLPPPLFPLGDTLAAFEHIVGAGDDHSWFLLNRHIAAHELSLSGSAHNPDLTDRDLRLVVRRALPRVFDPVQTFMDRLDEFVTASNLAELVARMNAHTGRGLVDEELVRRQVVAYDRQVSLGLRNDAQLAAIDTARNYGMQRRTRVARNQAILDPSSGPLIAVRLRVLTRKSLGGLQTDLDARVLRPDGEPLPGLYAAGEVAGFGGGGMHGRRSLEGTFLGGCIVSGRIAARALA